MDSVKHHGQGLAPRTESSVINPVHSGIVCQHHGQFPILLRLAASFPSGPRTGPSPVSCILWWVTASEPWTVRIVVFRSGFSASAPGTGLFCTFSRMRQFLKLLFLHILQYLDHPHCNQPPPAHIPSRSNPSCSLISHKKGNMQCIKALTQTGACVAAGCCRDADSLHL